ncbi:MAG: redoxin domain-containing protein [Polyangiaceae bacterium]|nr:redoxin domain-containing protein [Polyangiaceae bacterium]
MLPLAPILATLLAAGCQDAPKPAPEGSKAAQVAPGGETAELKEGDAAPDVELKLQTGNSIKLSSLRGKPVAIFFYPKDETPGCTVEAQGIRDMWADLSAANVAVIGVSTQDAESHKRFIEKEKLPFDLAVDTDGSLAKAFGVPLRNGHAARQTFLIGADGKVKKIWRQVTPSGHAAEILEAARS